jgi:hypothetical protein
MQPKMGLTPAPPVYLMLSFFTRRHTPGSLPRHGYGITPLLLVPMR